MPVCFKKKELELQKKEACIKMAKEKSIANVIPGRPVVLSQKRFSAIQQNADKDRVHREMEEKRAERERMNAQTEALMGHLTRTPEQKLAEHKKQLEEKNEKAKESLKISQQLNEVLRKEKIAQAELLVQKLQPGPRSLRSAAIQSELYRAREVQLQVNRFIQDSIVKQEELDKASCAQQAVFYVGEEQDRIKERAEMEKAYREEMVRVIREHERKRAENMAKKLEEERRERARIDAEILAQIEKERHMIEKRRAMLRKNAVEAMKIAEERKKRDAMYDEVEDRLGCLFNTAHRHLEKLKSEQAKEFAIERQKQIDKNTEMLANIQKTIQNKESERIMRDINTMKLQFDVQEQKKRNRERELKRQRIEAHLKEMEEIRLAKDRAEEIKRFEIAQRFKNVEVNARFQENDMLVQQQRAKCVRERLKAQEEERQRQIREREAKGRMCDDHKLEQEDHFFFKYAHTLMKDAKRKQRPLYPFKKVINEYKQQNMRDMEKTKTPRHLVSNVSIKLDTARSADVDEPRRNAILKLPSKIPETSSLSKVKAETLEHMAKIEALFAEDERRRADRSAQYCVPYDCSPESKDKIDENKGASTPPCKVRYNIEELKNLGAQTPSSH